MFSKKCYPVIGYDTMVLETVEEGIDQGFPLEESVPVFVRSI